MKSILFPIFSALILTGCLSTPKPQNKSEDILVQELKYAAKEQIIDKWYPLVLDHEEGGYYSDITRDFKLGEKT